MRELRRALGWRLATARTLMRNEWNVAGWDRGQRISIAVGDRVPVIFCTWRRLERLERTLEQLASQNCPVQALIWNNSSDRTRVDAIVRRAKIPVAVHNSGRNIGGFGRFYLAREAAEQGHKRVIFIDDDQDFGPGTIRSLLAAHRPRSLSGWWAFGFHSAAYEAKFRTKLGEAATLTGTGGMIADTAVFRDARLFGCPRRYWFVEDLWLSYVAGHLCDYTLFRSPAEFEFDESAEDENAQYHVLGHTKCRFVRYLVRQGWDPVVRGAGGLGAIRCGLAVSSDEDVVTSVP